MKRSPQEADALAKFALGENVIKEIHRLVNEDGLTYLEAVIEYYERTGLEMEVLAEIVSNSAMITSQLQIEGENLNFLPKTNRLPI